MVPPSLMVVVALALIDSHGRVLMQRRPAGKQHGDLWEFPGGKVEPGEGPLAALVREIDEELGIAVTAADLFPVAFAASEPSQPEYAPERPVLLLLYGARSWTGDPVPEPGAEIVWADRAMLQTLPMPPLDVPLAEALKNVTK